MIITYPGGKWITISKQVGRRDQPGKYATGLLQLSWRCLEADHVCCVQIWDCTTTEVQATTTRQFLLRQRMGSSAGPCNLRTLASVCRDSFGATNMTLRRRRYSLGELSLLVLMCVGAGCYGTVISSESHVYDGQGESEHNVNMSLFVFVMILLLIANSSVNYTMISLVTTFWSA